MKNLKLLEVAMNRLLIGTLILSFFSLNQGSYSASKSTVSVVPASSNQMILVIAANWNDLHTRMYLCEKNNQQWQVQKSFPAVCGKKGMAWGIGLYPENPVENKQPVKKEGDLKSPVGVFQFGECMGYAPKLEVNPNLEYQQLTESIQGVDDPVSQYYNQIVNTADFTDGMKIDWKSYEKMKRTDDLYKWLMVIKHNPNNIPGNGSLIFLHVWKNENSGTAGCTAVAEQNILEIFKWLDKGKNPVLVQLPAEIYQQNLMNWNLPLISNKKTTQ
jgi:L,D-peptidoglycan transpeptidase YkuD (ErfK/YbiS/YcfS/YnhG family)